MKEEALNFAPQSSENRRDFQKSPAVFQKDRVLRRSAESGHRRATLKLGSAIK
ncbi:MAG: hypothetical protein JWR15_2963 [Prosthecobacter sp.]|nr:hypothetical protein [Prosthecobacter sp.]